jgi:hypothetical protein
MPQKIVSNIVEIFESDSDSDTELNNINKVHAQVCLNYYKQGDDMYHCLVKENDKINVKKSIEKHIALLESVINHLKAIDDIIPDDNDLEINGDTHYIEISGSKNIIDNLVNANLANYDNIHDNHDNNNNDINNFNIN